MCLENAKNLRIFPVEAIVKVGDTLPDIHEHHRRSAPALRSTPAWHAASAAERETI